MVSTLTSFDDMSTKKKWGVSKEKKTHVFSSWLNSTLRARGIYKRVSAQSDTAVNLVGR